MTEIDNRVLSIGADLERLVWEQLLIFCLHCDMPIC